MNGNGAAVGPHVTIVTELDNESSQRMSEEMQGNLLYEDNDFTVTQKKKSANNSE